MHPNFKFPGRRGSSESVRPLARDMQAMSTPPPKGSNFERRTQPAGPAWAHRILRTTQLFCRLFTLPIPISLILVIGFTYIAANTPLVRERNGTKGGLASETWAPFWITIPLCVLWIPWWYVVWLNMRRAKRRGKPFLPARVHITMDALLLVLTTGSFAVMLWLIPRREAQIEMDFSYVKWLAALLGAQTACALGTLIGVLYEVKMENEYPENGVAHV